MIDISIAMSILVILSPVLIIIVVVLVFVNYGQVIFIQERSGWHGIPFRLFKKLPAFETISRIRRQIQNTENKYHEKIEEQPKHNYKMVKEIFVKDER